MRKRDYILQTACPQGMEWTAKGKTHTATRDLRPTDSVISSTYIPTFKGSIFLRFSYDNNGGRTAAVQGLFNEFLHLLNIYLYIRG